ncbi:MAG: glucose-6-phosphate isomerase [Candidatus Gracilibacteria bacterium]|nr:glucose-6-phosphate isomerase [Candidatus Gracilibacteria bacterium]
MENIRFKVGNREVELDIQKQELKYKDKVFTASVRSFGDMKTMYKKEDYSDNTPMYLMFREVYFDDKDLALYREKNIRYDITVLMPNKVAGEYNKTYGHFHTENKTGEKYNEIYEVLDGEAIYLLQDDKNYFYKSVASEQAYEMKHYGHVSSNKLEKPLVMANLVSNEFMSEYGDYGENKGAIIYLSGDENNITEEKNPNYKNNLEKTDAHNLYKADKGNIYDDFLDNSEKYFKILN